MIRTNEPARWLTIQITRFIARLQQPVNEIFSESRAIIISYLYFAQLISIKVIFGRWSIFLGEMQFFTIMQGYPYEI